MGFTRDPETLLRGSKRDSHCLLWTRTLQAHTVAVLTREGTNEDQTTWPSAGPAGTHSGQAGVSFQKLPRQEG